MKLKRKQSYMKQWDQKGLNIDGSRDAPGSPSRWIC